MFFCFLMLQLLKNQNFILIKEENFCYQQMIDFLIFRDSFDWLICLHISRAAPGGVKKLYFRGKKKKNKKIWKSKKRRYKFFLLSCFRPLSFFFTPPFICRGFLYFRRLDLLQFFLQINENGSDFVFSPNCL